MQYSISSSIAYDRLPEGVDVYVAKAPSCNVVTCRIFFPGGTLETYTHQLITGILSDMLPGSMQKKKRNAVLEVLESFGAQVSVSVLQSYTVVSISSRAQVFSEVFRFVLELLATATFPEQEFLEARARIEEGLKHALEDTGVQASTTLLHALYKKGHPHWSPHTKDLLREIHHTSLDMVRDFFQATFSSVGSFVCIVGDVDPELLLHELAPIIKCSIPYGISHNFPKISVVHTNDDVSVKDYIVPIHNKPNVDTVFGIPLSITHEHCDYDVLRFAMHVLGASSTSRLFSTLRTRENLTYGSYAQLRGFDSGYPGYLFGVAAFPVAVFSKGRDSLRNTVSTFVEKGITARELTEHKDEIIGRFSVTLSSTKGLASVIVANILAKKPLPYIDSFAERIKHIGHKEVQQVIKNHIDVSLLRTAAAGSVDERGQPLR